MASPMMLEDRRRSSPIKARGIAAVTTTRRFTPLFFHLTLGLIAVWTIATLLWAIDPAFLVHTGNLLAEVFGRWITRI